MKSNAPEKIYIFDNPILDFTKLSVRQSSEDIEYIRTDAFIEKACEWIKSMWSETDDRFKEDYTVMLIEDFKNYIKGE